MGKVESIQPSLSEERAGVQTLRSKRIALRANPLLEISLLRVFGPPTMARLRRQPPATGLAERIAEDIHARSEQDWGINQPAIMPLGNHLASRGNLDMAGACQFGRDGHRQRDSATGTHPVQDLRHGGLMDIC